MVTTAPEKPLAWFEYKVLACLHEGMSDKEISTTVHVGPQTARFYVYRIRSYMGTTYSNRVEMALWVERVLNGKLANVYPQHREWLLKAKNYLRLES